MVSGVAVWISGGLSFIKLVAPLENVPENILMGQFINGLKDEVKAEVRLLNPINLDWAMDLAVRVEEKKIMPGPIKEGEVGHCHSTQ